MAGTGVALNTANYTANRAACTGRNIAGGIAVGNTDAAAGNTAHVAN